MAHKFVVGQKIIYTNDGGVCWGEKTVVAVENITYSPSGYGYKIEPTDTPWFCVKEENLKEL